MLKTLTFISTALLLCSCSRPPEEIPGYAETVNGFKVEWRKNVSEDKKGVVRDILNEMVHVKGGVFLMGATQEQNGHARSNEHPAHYVRISDYYICQEEINAEQVEILLGTELSSYEHHLGAPDFSWNDWRYVLDVIREYSGVPIDFPTEAQWEFAARGGLESLGSLYPGGDDLNTAIYSDNELGLTDMAGGHSEWCKDAYNEYSGFSLETNPFYIQGRGHVVRGGNSKSTHNRKDYFNRSDSFISCYNDIRTCRVSARSYCDNSQSSLYTLISCRPVINIDNEH